jgi:hypothetical protein
MENLESILAENMRRFNTKNLNEMAQDAVAEFIKDAKIRAGLKLGYNFIGPSKQVGDNLFSYNPTTDEMEEWTNAHILFNTSDTNMLIQGQMASYKFQDANGQTLKNPIKKWIARPLTLIQPNYMRVEKLAPNSQWIDVIGIMMQFMDSKAIIAGGKQFLDALKIQSPPMATNQDLFKLVQVKRNDKNWMYGWSINKYAVYAMYGFKPVEPK